MVLGLITEGVFGYSIMVQPTQRMQRVSLLQIVVILLGDGKMVKVNSMKKILSFVATLCLLMASASALVQYTGAPQFPYLVFGHVEWNTQNIANAQVELSNLNTGS